MCRCPGSVSDTGGRASVGPMADTRVFPAARRSLDGLTEAEAARLIAERGEVEPPATSRSLASIVRANVFTVFNLILVSFGVLTFAFGHWEDALFLAILVANSGIGIYQEWRAKQALDRLAALVAPHATVVREGRPRRVEVDQVVDGDLLRIEAGDQLVADGVLEQADALSLDESVLTGESEAVPRFAGDEVRSGSFAVEGSGLYTVTAVGKESYAEKVADVARTFRHPRSPLERALNRLLFVLVGVMIPLGAIFGYALVEQDKSTRETVTTAVAGVVTLIPEGLILLTSVTFAVAALRMARRGALAQQLNAVESLAAAEIVCLDKTGTLTESALQVAHVTPAPGVDEQFLTEALGRYAASSPSTNATLHAIAEAFPATSEAALGHVPFSSRRRWSAVRVGAVGYVLGAPELFELGPLAEGAATEQQSGRRVVALGTTAASFERFDVASFPDLPPPGDLQLLGIVVLGERLRAEARETVAFFLREGVQLKVLSGDAPATVAAIAEDAGIPSTGPPLDGRELPEDPIELRRTALDASVIGRISPDGKRRVIETLADAGHYVAMVGDGVNDVPALKAARLAIAQGSGSQMAKSVADVVLVSGDFGVVPKMVGEGRKVLRNLQRVTKLFVTKSTFAVVLILTAGLLPSSYPVLPRHLTLAAMLTIGIPGVFLALAPSSGPYSTPSFLREVARFAIPAGTATGLGVVSSYLFALNVINLPTIEAQTVSVTVLVIVGLYLVFVLEAASRTRAALVSVLCLVLLALYCLVLAFAGTRSFFQLAVPNAGIILSALGGSAVAIGGLWLTDDRFVPALGLPESNRRRVALNHERDRSGNGPQRP
jgi:cation-transporting ATPase E